MRLSSAALALVASLLVIGCAKEPPPTSAESALDDGGFSDLCVGGVRWIL
jgi:hypothetical protein